MGKITVSANGKSVVTKGSGGKAMATIPDVCITPFPSPPGPMPLPYPNIAESKDLTAGSIMTKFDGNSVATFGSFISQSKGDEVGSMGGIISGTIKGKATFMAFSPDVKVEMRPVCRKGDLMIMNEFNTLGLTGMDQPDVGDVEAEQIEDPEWLEFQVVDEETGEPLARTKCLIVYSDGTTIKARTDKEGFVKKKMVQSGDFEIVINSGEYGFDD